MEDLGLVYCCLSASIFWLPLHIVVSTILLLVNNKEKEKKEHFKDWLVVSAMDLYLYAAII